MNPAELGTLIAGLAALVGAVFTGVKVLAGRPVQAMPDYGALTAAYDEMVTNLREEIARLRARLTECETQLHTLQTQWREAGPR